MKLVTNSILILSLVMTGMSDEQFVFPPKFSKPNSGIFTDSSLYLPPESHTPLPYFPMKNSINLPFPYLPPTRTKAPPVYPSPFPVMMSTTFMPNYEDDERENDSRENKGSRPLQKLPHQNNNEHNKTEKHQEVQTSIKRDMRQNFQHPIDRVDVRLPMGFSTPKPINQNPTARSMIIDHRNDHGFDQLRAASSQAYVPPPGYFLSSTTEPAIPILRLSNEMDLDGSFSYEALGADQTHYVQQSHMENSGTDKEEQVVEGSYSYVGDNGQTYTVHYIADSNGFRASGDHLPVAPPIPEIIQRSIQYNLAEEAKKPPHLKSWQENQDYEINEIKESNHRFSIQTPPRNLFTGRTPEAFSNNFSQRSNTQNSLLTAASSQHTVQAVPDFSDQKKGNANGAPITPQVTFIASQGAHVPSPNTGNQMSRLFSSEKPNMPQLINYDAAYKDVEQDGNKALWRWQYGLNSQNVNQTPEKNSISRSSGEGDDVMINFSDMSPEQYSKMIQTPEETNLKEEKNVEKYMNTYNNNQNFDNNNDNNKYQYLNQKSDNNNHYFEFSSSVEPLSVYTTENTATFSPAVDEYKLSQHNLINSYNQESIINFKRDQNPEVKTQVNDIKPKIINSYSFTPPSQMVTQTYNYEESSYEPKKIIPFVTSTTMKPEINYLDITNNNNDYKVSPNTLSPNINMLKSDPSLNRNLPEETTVNTLKFSDFITLNNNSEFRPITISNKENESDKVSTTTESDVNILSNNIFLNKFINVKKQEQKSNNLINDESNKQQLSKIYTKIPKFISSQDKPYNEIKNIKKKTFDFSEIFNYITNKNHFESSKTTQKSNLPIYDTYNQRKELHLIPIQTNKDDDMNEYSEDQPNLNRLRTTYHHHNHHEIPGNIKNYKLLLRNNKAIHNEEDNGEIRRELAPPPIKRLQQHNMPPLGRAGPSVKTYLPPIFV